MTTETLPYSPLVEAFTYGQVSKTSPIYLVFSEEVDPEKQSPEYLAKNIRMKPDAAGTFAFEDSRTIVFTPESAFDRDKTYSITADLSAWFDNAEKQDKAFTFKFSTLPMAIRGDFETLNINEDDNSKYDAVVSIYSADRETPETIESIITVEANGKPSTIWVHSPDGKKHQMRVVNITPSKDRNDPKMLNVKVKSNKFGVKSGTLLSSVIPASEPLYIVRTDYITSPERYVEMTFNRMLSQNQNLYGMILVNDEETRNYNIEENKIKVFPSANSHGELRITVFGNFIVASGGTEAISQTFNIDLGEDKPDLRFIGNGNIIPQSPQLLVPFESIYLRGVVVRIIKINENNIGQFLQMNQMNGGREIRRVGRLVARQTVFFDESLDFTKWNTYALDLRNMIEPEPGAIYRVQLSYDRDLSAYPCSDFTPPSKESILALDESKLAYESSQYDNPGTYYYWDEDYDYYYDWRDDYGPCNQYYYEDRHKSLNVLATNLGLMAKRGREKEMLLMVHNLLNTNPEKGVTITLYNYQQQPIGSGVTDENGQVRIAYDNSLPFYAMAQKGKELSFMRVDDGNALSMSSFDVSGETVQKGIKGFIYGDRGVWRPGDTMYISFMLSDRTKSLPEDHPVTVELFNPEGLPVQKKTQNKGVLGLYSFELTTEPDAPTGSWSVVVTVGGASFTKNVRVEAIKPNRLKIDLKFDSDVLLNGESVKGSLHSEWLTGAKTENLKYDIDVTFTSTETRFDKFNGYVFDDPLVSYRSENVQLSGVTDSKGDAAVNKALTMNDAAPGMLRANMAVRVYEPSGDFSTDVLNVRFSPYRSYTGIKSPQTGDRWLDTEKNHRFDIATVKYDGTPDPNRRVTVKVYKVGWYWWYESSATGLSSYVSDSYNTPVKTMYVDTDSIGLGYINLNFPHGDWGTYYIMVTNGSHSTGLLAYFDWPYLDGNRAIDGSDMADKLIFKTDKTSYAPGETITITIPSAKGNRAVVSVENGTRVLSVTEHMCDAGETRIKIPATAEMQPNAFINITLLQKHGMTQNDLPIRLYGVVPVTVSSPESRLTPEIKTADEIRPESKYEIVVSEKNGREMAYTIAVVDEGLLDLTRFKTPEPWSVFNAHEALGVTSWDMYRWVMGAYTGRIDQMFSIGGDDEILGGPKAIVNRFKPVVTFAGPFLLKKNSKQKHSFDMPNYNGRVRVMVVASNGEAFGNANKSVMVRKPVMVLGTLPRVIGIDEEMLVPATVFAMKENVGNVNVTIKTSDNMEILGSKTQTVNFSETGDKTVNFRVRVKNATGSAKVTLTAVSSNDKSTYETDIEIRNVRRQQTKSEVVVLKPGETLKQNVEMPGAAGTNFLTLEASTFEPVDLSSRLSFLLGYPHGCIEQITSKGFPQLYLNDFVALTKEQKTIADEAVKEVLRRQKSYQTSKGGMSYWPGGNDPNQWGSIYAAHFMMEAEAKGYAVPDVMKRSLINYLKSEARSWAPATGNYQNSSEMTQAYRLYVLALSGNTEMGSMNRLREQETFSDMTRWMLGAAYAIAGREDIAKQLTEKTSDAGMTYGDSYDTTFGSDTRDEAIKLITLVQMGNMAEAMLKANYISRELSTGKWMSTQTSGFALVALSKYIGKSDQDGKLDFSYDCAGKSDKVKSDMSVWTNELVRNGAVNIPLEVVNKSKNPLFVKIVKSGTPFQGTEEAYANKLQIDVSYKDLSGRAVNVTDMKQGTNFTATVVVKNPTSGGMQHVVLTQIFPSGWEILNTRYASDGTDNVYPAGLNYQDIRDDRVYSYIDLLPSGRQVTVNIKLAATYVGTFYMPPVYCDLMYDSKVTANTQSAHITVSQL